MDTYTTEQVNDIINDFLEKERYVAWVTMANLGIPEEKIPAIYRNASAKVTAAVLKTPVPHLPVPEKKNKEE